MCCLHVHLWQNMQSSQSVTLLLCTLSIRKSVIRFNQLSSNNSQVTARTYSYWLLVMNFLLLYIFIITFCSLIPVLAPINKRILSSVETCNLHILCITDKIELLCITRFLTESKIRICKILTYYLGIGHFPTAIMYVTLTFLYILSW